VLAQSPRPIALSKRAQRFDVALAQTISEEVFQTKRTAL
jgi:hypothetical protein